jgi:DNA-binding transcriptional regulator YiaG
MAMLMTMRNAAEAEHIDPVQVALFRKQLRNGEAREIRERSHVSATEAAKHNGVTTSTVLRWEAGEREPRAAAAVRYGRFLRELTEAGL